MRCAHCWAPHKASAAPELNPDESLELCDELAALGTRSVHLTGGEPLLRADWSILARRLTTLGIAVHLRSSGVGLDEAALADALDARVRSVTIPLDGPAEIHNQYRSAYAPGTDPHAAAVEAIGLCRDAELGLKVATQVNRRNIGSLPRLSRDLDELGVEHWKQQLCRPDFATFGRSDLYLHPSDLPRLFDVLESVHAEGRLRLAPAHSLGYYTRLEPLLRPRSGQRPPVWSGCEAGLGHFAVECDGKVKGCTALPSEFAAASVRDRPLADIWRDDACFAYTRQWKDEWFEGECRSCGYRSLCRAGCTAVAYGSTGSVGYNPYCLHRVAELV